MVDRSHEDKLSFGEIAEQWAKEESAPGGTPDEVLLVMVKGMWLGQFEQGGKSVIALPRNRQHDGTLYDIYGSTETPRLETTEPDISDKWMRQSFFDALYGKSASAKNHQSATNNDYQRLSKLTLAALDDMYGLGSIYVDTYLRDIWIGRNDFSMWCKANKRRHPKFWFPVGQPTTPRKGGAKYVKYKSWAENTLTQAAASTPKWTSNNNIADMAALLQRKAPALFSSNAIPSNSTIRRFVTKWLEEQK